MLEASSGWKSAKTKRGKRKREKAFLIWEEFKLNPKNSKNFKNFGLFHKSATTCNLAPSDPDLHFPAIGGSPRQRQTALYYCSTAGPGCTAAMPIEPTEPPYSQSCYSHARTGPTQTSLGAAGGPAQELILTSMITTNDTRANFRIYLQWVRGLVSSQDQEPRVFQKKISRTSRTSMSRAKTDGENRFESFYNLS